MNKLLITGASGFLGGHVYQQACASEQWDVLAGYGKNPPKATGGDWYKLDLLNLQLLKSQIIDVKPDVVVHSAAISNLDVCEKDPDTAYHINSTSTSLLAELSKQLGFRLIFISTDMVFDGSGSLYLESNPVSPISVYGKSKVRAEKAVLDKSENAVILRSALIYGRPAIAGSSFSMWIENQLAKNAQISLYNDQFRTPVLVNNMARVILELVDHNYTGVLHLGGSERIDRYHFGLKLCELGGYDRSLLSQISMNEHKPLAPRPVDVSLNIEKTCNNIKTPILNIHDGLLEMLNAGK